jgi:hypothetical protein
MLASASGRRRSQAAARLWLLLSVRQSVMLECQSVSSEAPQLRRQQRQQQHAASRQPFFNLHRMLLGLEHPHQIAAMQRSRCGTPATAVC